MPPYSVSKGEAKHASEEAHFSLYHNLISPYTTQRA